MIDALTLLLTHGLLALAGWRLLLRGDLDVDPADPPAPRIADKTVTRHRRDG